MQRLLGTVGRKVRLGGLHGLQGMLSAALTPAVAAADATADAAAADAALITALATSSDFLELVTPASRPRAPPARSSG